MYKVATPYINPDLKHDAYNKNFKFNSLGFRGNEFDPNKKNILIAGCSIYFCSNVEDQYIFPNLLVEKLGEEYGYLNVSMPGTGIDAQMKNITWALSNFKFEKFIWLSPTPARSLYYHETYGILTYCPGAPAQFMHKWFSSAQGQEWINARISNDHDTACKIADQLETLCLLLKTLNLDSYVKSWAANNVYKMDSLRYKFNLKHLPEFHKIDYGSDNLHAGINSHSAYADALYKLLKP